MGVTSTLYTALSGLSASQTRLDVAGNNIANVNTTGYKSTSVDFQTQLSRTLSAGAPPGVVLGGTNPRQIGLGVSVGSIGRDFSNGSIDPTGVNTDLAIDGNGFFVLRNNDGSQVYTRDGSFTLDAEQKLVSSNGRYVLGYAVDTAFNLDTGNPTSLTIPVGNLTIAKATENATLSGNLDPYGTIATTPEINTSVELVSTVTGLPITAATSMTDVALASAPGTALFAVGTGIKISGQKGTSDILPTSSFTVTNAATADVNSGATVAEYLEWVQAQCGINTSLAAEPTAGATLTANGEIQVTSNLGPGNALTNLKYVADAGGSSITSGNSDTADGVSETTAFRAYDSLGGPVDVTLTYVLINKSDTGNTWRYYATSGDDTDNPVVGTGTVKFDTSGRYLESTDTSITINRAGTGAVDPVIIDLNMQQLTGSEKASGQESSIQMLSQDGYPTGTLNDFAIASNGEILGTFSNGLTRTLGQVVLGSFSNSAGLIEAGDNTYTTGPNSGAVAIVTPGDLGTGTLIGGALELSNVDITSEFVDMITATTAFSASGRVITTSQQLLTELLQMVR